MDISSNEDEMTVLEMKAKPAKAEPAGSGYVVQKTDAHGSLVYFGPVAPACSTPDLNKAMVFPSRAEALYCAEHFADPTKNEKPAVILPVTVECCPDCGGSGVKEKAK
jgi:hypothetical protein